MHAHTGVGGDPLWGRVHLQGAHLSDVVLIRVEAAHPVHEVTRTDDQHGSRRADEHDHHERHGIPEMECHYSLCAAQGETDCDLGGHAPAAPGRRRERSVRGGAYECGILKRHQKGLCTRSSCMGVSLACSTIWPVNLGWICKGSGRSVMPFRAALVQVA